MFWRHIAFARMGRFVSHEDFSGRASDPKRSEEEMAKRGDVVITNSDIVLMPRPEAADA
jgi:hypothetical protein